MGQLSILEGHDGLLGEAEDDLRRAPRRFAMAAHFDDFCDKVGTLKVDDSLFPQHTADLTELYAAAREARPIFEEVLKEALEELQQHASRAGKALKPSCCMAGCSRARSTTPSSCAT